MSERELWWVGLDVAKHTFDASVVSPGRKAKAAAFKELPVKTFDRTAEGVKQFVAWLSGYVPAQAPLPARAVMEATGAYSIELAALLYTHCPELSASVVNPEWTKAYGKSLGLRNKTDRMDARALAFYGLERSPEPYEPLSANQAELRALTRCREDLIESCKGHENQLTDGPQCASVRKSLASVVAHITKTIAAIDDQIRALIGRDESLKRDYDLLNSIPGVGFVTAAVVLAEFGDLRRFGRSRQIGAHAGVTTQKNDSGQYESRGRMSKKGNVHVRRVLYMAAMSAKTFNPLMREVYQRLTSRGKKPMVALGTIMRKLLVLMRAIVIARVPFDPCGKPRTKKVQTA
jgi:transposase